MSSSDDANDTKDTCVFWQVEMVRIAKPVKDIIEELEAPKQLIRNKVSVK